MHLALNFLYLALLCLFAPLLIFRSFRSGKYREGWSEKVLGKAPGGSAIGPASGFTP